MARHEAIKHKVVVNQLGRVVPVRLRITPSDWATARGENDDANTSDLHDGAPVRTPLELAVARVLNPRYVAEVGVVPGSTDAPTGRRFQLTVRRYVGKRLDPVPVFVVELTPSLFDCGLHEAAVRSIRSSSRFGFAENDSQFSGRFTLPLPAKARRAPRQLKAKNGPMIDSPMRTSPRSLESLSPDSYDATPDDVIRID